MFVSDGAYNLHSQVLQLLLAQHLPFLLCEYLTKDLPSSEREIFQFRLSLYFYFPTRLYIFGSILIALCKPQYIYLKK